MFDDTHAVELLTGGGKPVYPEGPPAEEDEKGHFFCKTDPASVVRHPLFNEPTFRMGLENLMKAASVEVRAICIMCGWPQPFKCHHCRPICEVLVSEAFEVLPTDEKGETVP